jgi:septal ring factor EnvC (AmiA/AmiB activator)
MFGISAESVSVIVSVIVAVSAGIGWIHRSMRAQTESTNSQLHALHTDNAVIKSNTGNIRADLKRIESVQAEQGRDLSEQKATISALNSRQQRLESQFDALHKLK